MSNTPANFSATVRTGGDGAKGCSAVGTLAQGLLQAGKQCIGFLLTTDGEFDYTTFNGDVVTDAVGTWALNVIHPLWINAIAGSSTAVGKLHFA